MDTYKLDIPLLANGSIRYKTESGHEMTFNASDSSQTLDIMDCYRIGKQSFISKDYYNAIQWFNETIKRVDSHTSNGLKSSIAKYLALCYYNLNDPYQARDFIYQSNIFTDYYSEAFQFNKLFADLIVSTVL